MNKIYLAQSMADYGSVYIEHVKGQLTNFDEDVEIVDPAELEHLCIKGKGYSVFKRNMNKVFFPAIRSCDNVIYVPRFDTGKITAGVRAEIKYAESIGKPVSSSERFYGPEMLDEELYHEQHG